MPEELEPFDAREYLNAGDWQTALVKRGWHQAPGDLASVRKDFFSPLGWAIHIWVEQDAVVQNIRESTMIIAFGPNGSRLGCTWFDDDEALEAVDQLEKIIDLDQPYEVVQPRVSKFLRALPVVGESEEPFDPRDYLDALALYLEGHGYLRTGDGHYSVKRTSAQMVFKVYVDTGSDRGTSEIMVEGRPNNWAETGFWHQGGDFRSLLYCAFSSSPPMDYVEQLDEWMTHFTGTFEEAEIKLTHDKSHLIALGDRAFKARKRVESLVDKLLDSEELFDPRDYMLSMPSFETFYDALGTLGWKLRDRESHWGWKWTKEEYEIGGVMCNLTLYILPEFPHEAHVEVQANYTDDNGFEHWKRIEQPNGWWEMERGEAVDEYTARMADGMGRNLNVANGL